MVHVSLTAVLAGGSSVAPSVVPSARHSRTAGHQNPPRMLPASFQNSLRILLGSGIWYSDRVGMGPGPGWTRTRCRVQGQDRVGSGLGPVELGS